ncbi:MAG: hypothetical protein JNM42_19260 [Propionivibrio sp.]|uniref:hypothetical protein n=1 Tax=Propionivibrio sp. TaxID=2212460 RepID=UPI001A373FE2|nr:hypothetical protein [Propionivibrio sp.]MBL8416568.1 hypothetical protein [Propionivibrio sp.]
MRYLALLFAVVLSCPCWADKCDQLPKPSVTVKRLDTRVTVNTQHGYKVLNHLGSALARPGNQILGLTRVNDVAHFASSTPLHVDRSGRWECASPQLTLTLGFNPMTVYVAKEFPEGGCAYKEIYQHELRHVKAYQAHLSTIENELSESLNRRFATGGAWRGPVGQTRADLQRELDERWLPYIQREFAHADEAQALIDTPEEYARVANACNGEIRKRTR